MNFNIFIFLQSIFCKKVNGAALYTIDYRLGTPPFCLDFHIISLNHSFITVTMHWTIGYDIYTVIWYY